MAEMNVLARALKLGVALVAVGSSGCGERKPGAVPSAVEFWNVVDTTLEFGACGDDPGFRQQISPTLAEPGSVFVYRVSADGRSARQQQCGWLSASTCADSEPPLVFEVAGTQLIHAREEKGPIGKEGCQLINGQSWVGSDLGQEMVLEISNALSLVDDPAACARVDSTFRQQSPNGLGLDGCIFTWRMLLDRQLR
jgi:hypothetical protein